MIHTGFANLSARHADAPQSSAFKAIEPLDEALAPSPAPRAKEGARNDPFGKARQPPEALNSPATEKRSARPEKHVGGSETLVRGRARLASGVHQGAKDLQRKTKGDEELAHGAVWYPDRLGERGGRCGETEGTILPLRALGKECIGKLVNHGHKLLSAIGQYVEIVCPNKVGVQIVMRFVDVTVRNKAEPPASREPLLMEVRQDRPNQSIPIVGRV